MALLPELHVNLGEFSFERVYQLFLPLVPGGALVGGLVLNDPASLSAKAVAFGIGSYPRVAILVCAAYVTGLALYGVSMLIAGSCTAIVGHVVYKKWPPRRPNSSSKSLLFRRVAAQFLGESLIPSAAVPPYSDPFVGNDTEWQDWYNILQDYVLRRSWTRLNEIGLLFVHLQATGWALLYLHSRTVIFANRWVFAVSVILIVEGAVIFFGLNYNYWKNDRLSAWDFVARLVGEIRSSAQTKT